MIKIRNIFEKTIIYKSSDGNLSLEPGINNIDGFSFDFINDLVKVLKFLKSIHDDNDLDLNGDTTTVREYTVTKGIGTLDFDDGNYESMIRKREIREIQLSPKYININIKTI